MHIEFWWRNLLDRGHLEDRRRWEVTIKIDLKEELLR
jgi:hypothetical protein